MATRVISTSIKLDGEAEFKKQMSNVNSELKTLRTEMAYSEEAFANTCWFLWKLAEQGELVRRWMGHRPQPIPQERQLLAMLGPLDVPRAKEAIGEAARLGFAMETPRERAERIDLGLQKLKEADGSDKVTMAQYLAPMLRLLNMNVHDALMLTPGQTGDLLAQVTRKE